MNANNTFKTILISVSASFVTLGLIVNFLIANDKENKDKIDTTNLKVQTIEIKQATIDTKLDSILDALKDIKDELKDKRNLG